jgi:uncharacterized protein
LPASGLRVAVLMPDLSGVEIVYALPEKQYVIGVDLVDGLTAIAAVRASGLLEAVPGLAGKSLDLAVFGQRVAGDYVLRAGDRVEILRPLKADPREMRRRLAAGGQTMGKR